MILRDDLTEEQLANLSVRGTDEEKRAVAMHPNASLETLLYLSKIDFADDVDRNPLLPLYIESGFDDIVKILEKIAEQTQRGERLEELASSVWLDVRYGVAMNANTTPATLSFLANDKEMYVRRGVAENESTHPTTLSFLAKDQKDYVRRGVASNANTHPTTLSILAKDLDEYVCLRVAENANTPKTTLSLLAKDKSRAVSRSARSTLTKLKKADP